MQEQPTSRASKTKAPRVCLECGAPLDGGPASQRYCGSSCRQIFNNRRMQRGAELYDLFMVMRYERDEAKAQGVWSMMCRMGQQMREEDQAKREGRRSWRKAKDVLADRPDLKAVRIVGIR